MNMPSLRSEAIARINTQKALRRMGFVVSYDNYAYLEKLLGVDNIMDNMTEEHIRLCHLIAGPNGYVIVRMLLAQQEVAA
jgi:hypothetical protein